MAALILTSYKLCCSNSCFHHSSNQFCAALWAEVIFPPSDDLFESFWYQSITTGGFQILRLPYSYSQFSVMSCPSSCLVGSTWQGYFSIDNLLQWHFRIATCLWRVALVEDASKNVFFFFWDLHRFALTGCHTVFDSDSGRVPTV